MFASLPASPIHGRIWLRDIKTVVRGLEKVGYSSAFPFEKKERHLEEVPLFP
jgi:hypothetical protein